MKPQSRLSAFKSSVINSDYSVMNRNLINAVELNNCCQLVYIVKISFSRVQKATSRIPFDLILVFGSNC